MDRALRGCIPKAPDTAAGCFSLRTHEAVKPRKRALTSLRHASTPARGAGACSCITTVAADRIRQHLPPPHPRGSRAIGSRNRTSQSRTIRKWTCPGQGRRPSPFIGTPRPGAAVVPPAALPSAQWAISPLTGYAGHRPRTLRGGGRESRSLHTDLPFDTVDMKIYLLYGDVNDQFGVVRPCGPVVRNRTFPYG